MIAARRPAARPNRLKTASSYRYWLAPTLSGQNQNAFGLILFCFFGLFLGLFVLA